MSALTLGLLAAALSMGLAGALAFAWAARNGQFDDLEDVKYQLLREGHNDE